MKKIFSLFAALLMVCSMWADVTPVTLTFKDWGDTSAKSATDTTPKNKAGDNSVAYTVDNLLDSIDGAAGFVTCKSTAKAYAARVNYGCKLGTGSLIGYINLGLVNPAEFDSVVILCASYSTGEGSISINGGDAIDLTNGGADNKVLKNVVYTPAGTLDSLFITTTAKRAFVKSITFYPKSGVTPTPTTGCDWDNISYLGDGAQAGALTDKYKMCVPAESGITAVNVQHPTWGTADGIYVTLGSAVDVNCGLGAGKFDVDGAGMLLHLDAFTAKYTDFTVSYGGNDYACTVYYADGTEGGDEPEPAPTPAMESLIQFTETASAGALNGQTLGTGFTLTVTDTGSKIAVDANSAMFGTSAADTIRFAYRMKSGGKSSASNCLSLVAPKDGKLIIYARTGSNSATDRNVVVTNAEGTEIINHICLEADTLAERIDGNKVYLPISADITAGTYAITYPTSSINFYGFKLDTVVAPQPEPEPTATDIYVMGIASWNASDEYKMTETVTGSEWTYDFGTTELVGKTFKFATADWSTVNLGQDTEGLKEGTIAVKQGSNTNISVASNYSSATNVVVTLKKDAEGNWTVTAAGTFVEGTPAIPDLYLRGINGSWDATDANKFAKAESKDEWTLTLDVTDVTKKFKVADANWGSYNFGAGTDALALDAAYTLVSGGGDIALPADAAAGNYTFTVVKGEDVWTLMDVWKLTVSKNETALDEINAQNGIQKFFENGHMFILKNGVRYDAAGKIVR